MGSLFDFFGRLAKGEPVFPEQNAGQSAPAVPQSPQAPAIRKGDASSFPVVYITFFKEHISGQKIQIYCRIRNTWPNQVMLDKIRAFGTTMELDTFLRANEEREFLVYSGPKLSREYNEAMLDYKTQAEGDYFEAVHFVTYAYRPEDKTYRVAKIQLRKPILDIYG